jgi:hypothetical protein
MRIFDTTGFSSLQPGRASMPSGAITKSNGARQIVFPPLTRSNGAISVFFTPKTVSEVM